MLSEETVARDKRYINLVGQYVRRELPKEFAETLEEDLDKLQLGLVTLKKDIELQLAMNKNGLLGKRRELLNRGDDGTEWLRVKAEDSEWRMRAIRLLRSTETALMSVKEMKKNRSETQTADTLTQTVS